MSEFARVPKSYLSRVTCGKADLNSDQMHLVCKYLSFSGKESDYMQLLLEFERCGLEERRSDLTKKIEMIQQQHLETKEHLRSTVTPDSDISLYYLEPLHQLTHILLSIKRFQTDQSLLAKHLNISPKKLLGILVTLEGFGIIRRTGSTYEVIRHNLHLPKESPLYKPWRNQVKLMTINRIDSSAESNPYSFSVMFSTSEEIRKKIHAHFLKYLQQVEKLVADGPQEEAYQMNFELFSWSGS